MKCSCCGGKTIIFDTRLRSYGKKRRRECKECGFKFTTMEIAAERVDGLMKLEAKLRKIQKTLNCVLNDIDWVQEEGAEE